MVAPGTRAPIESSLAYSLAEWAEVPRYVSAWAEWDVDQQMAFEFEWTIRDDRLVQLQQYAEAGLLTADQQHRYTQLLALVEQNRPIIERLFAEG